ncbi:MAG: hypothetical protein KA941_13760 [Flavobacteriales bacterium]|nr:hypothetical protein [Flavobacteriales bacterium]
MFERLERIIPIQFTTLLLRHPQPAAVTLERSTRLTLWLAVTLLFAPFIWIKIGPQGQAFYGPDVPDIYILGATILGKDRNDGGIAFAIWFQLVMGLCFILCAYVAFRRVTKGSSVQWVAVVQMQLLLMFPFWLCLYVDGVINNSDGAASDLRVYPHIGLVFYLLLWPLTINTFEKGGKGRIHFTAS